MEDSPRRAVGGMFAVRLFAGVLLLWGAALSIEGVQLAALGGSLYYALAGLAIIASAFQLWRGKTSSVWIYAAMLIGTWAWALWEVQLDAWALAPRLIAPAVLGLLFLIPAIARPLHPHGRKAAHIAGLCSVGLLLTIGVAAFVPDNSAPHLKIGDATEHSVDNTTEWPQYGGTLAGTRFSPLTQIDTKNVSRLRPAWVYRSGIVQTGQRSPMEATPIMVGDSLYLCSQTNVVIALDAETGTERWRFDPKVDPTGASLVTACRGVAYYKADASADCPERIITATFDARLIALHAQTGKPCASFGNNGTVDLKQGLGAVDPGFYYVSSAPTIVGGRIVLGGWIADNVYVGPPSGVIRAFDVNSGAFAWAWDLGKPGFHGQPGTGESYTRGTPNSWAPMSGDEALGLVYVPTGNSTPDHWGAHRSKLSDQFASSIVALDAKTGEPRWSFQTVHHDLWDYDVGSQPTLIDLTLQGERIPALIQPTKRGQFFVLDRRTGKPLTRVEERAVPQGAAQGDWTAPTQPYSTGMPDVAAGPPLNERDMWGLTPIDQLWCRIQFNSLRYEGEFTPPSTQGTLVYPGIGGGVNWGSSAVDPERQLLIVNSIRVPTRLQLIPRAQADAMLAGAHGFHVSLAPAQGTPFGYTLNTFASPLGVPCNRPPYGLISVIDLTTRKVVWSRPLGTARDSGPLGIPSSLPFTMGVPNFGGAAVTRSGLIFIGATQERALRAFDLKSGRELWYTRLPAGGQTTPLTYISPRSGRQFVVIAAGGSVLLQSKLGDYVMAYALPKS